MKDLPKYLYRVEKFMAVEWVPTYIDSIIKNREVSDRLLSLKDNREDFDKILSQLLYEFCRWVSLARLKYLVEMLLNELGIDFVQDLNNNMLDYALDDMFKDMKKTDEKKMNELLDEVKRILSKGKEEDGDK